MVSMGVPSLTLEILSSFLMVPSPLCLYMQGTMAEDYSKRTMAVVTITWEIVELVTGKVRNMMAESTSSSSILFIIVLTTTLSSPAQLIISLEEKLLGEPECLARKRMAMVIVGKVSRKCSVKYLQHRVVHSRSQQTSVSPFLTVDPTNTDQTDMTKS